MSTQQPDLRRARGIIEAAEWRFASTMPEAPHWYAHRHKFTAAGGSDRDFSWLIALIREAGWPGRWRHMRGLYLSVDQHQYWTLGWPVAETLIINRARRDDPRSRAYPCGPLRPCIATTKAGTPCRNMAEAPRKHCPVHQHQVSEPELARQLEFFSHPNDEEEM